jgi:hypothetical protein
VAWGASRHGTDVAVKWGDDLNGEDRMDAPLPLEACQGAYLYDDWAQIAAGASLAREVAALPSWGQEADRAREKWVALLARGALFKRAGGINWRVPAEPPPLPQGLLEEIEALGRLVERLLAAVDRALGSSLGLRQALGFPACPEEQDLWICQGHAPVPFFRLDLALDRGSRPRLLEIQLVMGGLGMAQALREAYGPHPLLRGTAALYEKAVGSGLAGGNPAGDLPPGPRPLVVVAGSRNSAYRHDHLILARCMRRLDMVVAPLACLTFDQAGGARLPDGRRAGLIHRLFRSPSLFRNSPARARSILEAVRAGTVRLIPPWKDVLEDKRVLALVHDPRPHPEVIDAFSPGEWERLKDFVPVTRPGSPGHLCGLLGLPRSRRALYLKKGRSFESRHLWDGRQIGLRQWDAACLRARCEGDWIVQEAVQGDPWPFRYLDMATHTMREMLGHVRLSPYFFREPDGALRMGELLITARQERSRVHGASDAVLVVPGAGGGN